MTRLLIALAPLTARAAVVDVPPGTSIQAALDAALDGDVLSSRRAPTTAT